MEQPNKLFFFCGKGRSCANKDRNANLLEQNTCLD